MATGPPLDETSSAKGVEESEAPGSILLFVDVNVKSHRGVVREKADSLVLEMATESLCGKCHCLQFQEVNMPTGLDVVPRARCKRE